MSVHYVPAKAGGRAPTPDILGAVLTGEEQNAIETKEIMDSLIWDYTQAGANMKPVIEHTVELKRSERRASEAIIQAGKHLLAVKELLPHGAWLGWLETEFKMSDRTARNMMSIATKFGAKSETVSDLSVSVLYLLAGDSVPEAAREEVIQRAAAGETVTKAAAKAVIEEHKPKPEPKPLTPEQLDEFFAWYWNGYNLQSIANDSSPLAALRSVVEQGSIGASNRVWRYDIRNGYIRIWHQQNGNMFDRNPDVAWLLHDFVRKSAAYLPERNEVNTATVPIIDVPVDVPVVGGYSALDCYDDTVTVDAEADEDGEAEERPVTHEMLVAKFSIWKWLVEQCGPADFKGMVELAEALHYQESAHPLWFKMYPKGADIDHVFWGLESCIDDAAGLVPEYAQQAAFVPVGNLKAAVLGWVRKQYPDFLGQVAALECMIADPMHDEDMQRMEPTLPAPYRKDDLLVALMQASIYLDSLKDDEPEEAPQLDGTAARRMNRLHTLKVRFQESIDLLPEFGVLTGHYVDTNPAKRALRELIDVLESEMDALAASAKGGAEG